MSHSRTTWRAQMTNTLVKRMGRIGLAFICGGLLGVLVLSAVDAQGLMLPKHFDFMPATLDGGALRHTAPRPIVFTAATLDLLEQRPVLEVEAFGFIRSFGTDRAALDTTLIDGFEGSMWPDRARWPLVADLDTVGGSGIGHFWAPSVCEASTGLRSLRAVGGGDGASLDCATPYPSDIAASALLYLDLRTTTDASLLELRFDAWLDADPDEGLMVNYTSFDASGRMAERRVLMTATGRSRAWWRGMTLDLTELTDRLDSGWSGDLRGRRAYIEFLFISHDGSADAAGAYIDDVVLDVEIPPTPTASSTPLPSATPTSTLMPDDIERINACSTISDCDALTVRAYFDYGCDGRFQPGVDVALSGARVNVNADAEALGTELGGSGSATFRFPRAGLVESMLALPIGYETCESSPNPVTVEGRRFERTGRASISFRLRRIR